jgi:hypothetical protein
MLLAPRLKHKFQCPMLFPVTGVSITWLET